MRLQITLCAPRSTALPANYNEYLTGAVYGYLERSSADYARFLHDEGYASDDGPKRFKLFTYSQLRTPPSRRRISGDMIHFAAGPITWTIASPVTDFLEHFAGGLLAAGHLQLGPTSIPITEVHALPAPEFTDSMRFTCLSPVVASVRRPDGGTDYLVPADGEKFSTVVRNNLIAKHRAIHGDAPADDRFTMTFDAEYLARGGGTKLIRYKDIEIRGAFAPFTATGSPDLIRVGYEAGFGSKGAMGFGCVEARG